MSVGYSPGGNIELAGVSCDLRAARLRLCCALECFPLFHDDEENGPASVVEEVMHCLEAIRREVDCLCEVYPWPSLPIHPRLFKTFFGLCQKGIEANENEPVSPEEIKVVVHDAMTTYVNAILHVRMFKTDPPAPFNDALQEYTDIVGRMRDEQQGVGPANGDTLEENTGCAAEA